MSFAACLDILKEPGAHTVVVGMVLELYHHPRFGLMMFIVLVMNKASRSVVMTDGETAIAFIGKTLEWSANTHQ